LASALIRRWRQQTLLRQFSIAASTVLLLGMITIGTWVADRIRTSVINNSATTAALHMDGFVSPLVQELATSPNLQPKTHERLDNFIGVLIGNRIVGMKIWSLDGTVVYSNWKDLVGRNFPPTDHFTAARDGSLKAALESNPHEISSPPLSIDAPLLEIYAPIRDGGSGRVIAVAEYYSIERELASELSRAMTWSWLVVGLVTLGMMAGIFGIVLTGSRTIERQRHQLHNQIDDLKRLLEQNQDLRQRVQRAHHRSARINERVLRRVGADLHDGPAQLISLALLLLHTLKKEDSDSQLSHDLDRIRSALSEAMQDIRALSAGLVLPEIGRMSLDEVIRLAVQSHVGRTGIRPQCELSLPTTAVPDALKVCAYRFVQEALNNAFKHAAGSIPTVIAAGDETSVELTVSDLARLSPGLSAERTTGAP
jgi:signal transduction histidine kinase